MHDLMTVAHLGDFKGLGNVMKRLISALHFKAASKWGDKYISVEHLVFAFCKARPAAKRPPDVRQWMLLSEVKWIERGRNG